LDPSDFLGVRDTRTSTNNREILMPERIHQDAKQAFQSFADVHHQ
jgi:hypothetical protein